MAKSSIPRFRWCLGLIVSLVAGALAGFLVDVGGDYVPRTSLFLCPASAVYGLLAGHLVLSAFQTTPNRQMMLTVACVLAAGAVGGRAFVGLVVLATTTLPHPEAQYIFALLKNVLSPVLVLSVVSMVLGMMARLRINSGPLCRRQV